MIVNSHDVILTSFKDVILNTFKNSQASILISADDVSRPAWIDPSVGDKFEQIADGEGGGYKYVNPAGGIIGFASAVYEFLALETLHDSEDEQVRCSHLYIQQGKEPSPNYRLFFSQCLIYM